MCLPPSVFHCVGLRAVTTRLLLLHQRTSRNSSSSVKMPDSVEAVPASCQVIKGDVDKCVTEKGEQPCKDLMNAFEACIKTLSEGS